MLKKNTEKIIYFIRTGSDYNIFDVFFFFFVIFIFLAPFS